MCKCWWRHLLLNPIGCYTVYQLFLIVCTTHCSSFVCLPAACLSCSLYVARCAFKNKADNMLNIQTKIACLKQPIWVELKWNLCRKVCYSYQNGLYLLQTVLLFASKHTAISCYMQCCKLQSTMRYAETVLTFNPNRPLSRLPIILGCFLCLLFIFRLFVDILPVSFSLCSSLRLQEQNRQ